MQCLLLRHPPTLATEGLCYGRLDVAVDPAALHQCASQLSHLRDLPVYSSPAQRCLQLAHQLAATPTICPELQELDFGHWEGIKWDDIPRAALDAWAANIWHYRVGDAGESAAELRQRWQQLQRQLCSSNHTQIVIVSHAGLIRMALADAGLIPENERWSYPIAYATPYMLELPCPHD